MATCLSGMAPSLVRRSRVSGAVRAARVEPPVAIEFASTSVSAKGNEPTLVSPHALWTPRAGPLTLLSPSRDCYIHDRSEAQSDKSVASASPQRALGSHAEAREIVGEISAFSRGWDLAQAWIPSCTSRGQTHF